MQTQDGCYSFCVSESSAEQNIVLAVFAKAQPIQVWHFVCLRTLSKQSIASDVFLKSEGKIRACTIVLSKVQLSKTSNLLCFRWPFPANYSMDRVLKFCSKDKRGTIVFSKVRRCFLSPCRAESIYDFVNAGPARQSIAFTVFRDSAEKISVALLFLKAQPSKILHLLCFRMPGPAKYSFILCASTA